MEKLKRGDSASRDGILISEEEYERLQKDKEILDRAEQILNSIPTLSSSRNGDELDGTNRTNSK